jgi:hypothetical protein
MPKVSPAYGIESHLKYSYHTSFIKEDVVVYLCMRELLISQLLEQPMFFVGSQDDLSFGSKGASPFLRS